MFIIIHSFERIYRDFTSTDPAKYEKDKVIQQGGVGRGGMDCLKTRQVNKKINRKRDMKCSKPST